MNKIKYILLGLFLAMIVPLNVNAASGTISTSTNATTIIVGNTVTVYVTLSSGSDIGSWVMDLSYDSSILQLTSSNAEANGTRMVNSSSGTKSKGYTFTFKTLKTGNTSVRVNSYQVYGNDMAEMSISSYGKDISIKTYQDIIDSYSKDNNLKGLSVEGFELKETFDMNTLEYSVEVPEGTKEINVHADKNDYRSTVEGAGILAVTPGVNNFEILVRSQSGAEKIYKLTVNVIDQNPIEVTTAESNMTVVKLQEQLTLPTGYTETTIKMGDFDIPAFYSEELNYTLVGLKDEEGEVSLYIYDNVNNTYEKYIEYKFSGLIITPIPTDKTLENYKEFTEKIFDIETKVYKTKENSNFSIFYGKNVMTGEEGFYIYDEKNESVVVYDDTIIKDLTSKNELYTYIILGLAGIFLIMFIIIITLLVKNGKRRKQLKKIMNNNENKLEVKEKIKEEVKKDEKTEVKKDVSQKTKKINTINEDEKFENILDEKNKKKKKDPEKKSRSTRE